MKKLMLMMFALMITMAPAHAQLGTHTQEEPEQYVHLSIHANKTAVVPGETITLAFKHDIHPHWHTYWLNPGDSGEPTRISWNLPAGFEAADIQWPTPSRMPYEFLVNFGHGDQATYLVDISTPSDIAEDKITFKGEMSWLVCKEICIPEFQDFEITLPVSGSSSSANTDIFKNARAQMPIVKNWDATFNIKNGVFILSITADEITDFENIDVFPVEWGLIQNAVDQKVVYQNGKIIAEIPAGDRSLSELDQSDFVLRVTETSGNVKGYIVSGIKDTVLSPILNEQSKSSFGLQVLFAVLGGLILNLMPCVFPILSLKALGLAQAKGKERRENMLHGLSYTTVVLISFGILAAILLSVRSSIDVSLGWGFQLQNPTFILIFAYLIFTIGLSLSGVFTLGGKFTNIGANLSQKSGLGGSFFTGVLATLVATPCSAPFMAGAMGYALLQPSLQATFIFLSVGFGLALPYLLLTLSPTLQKILPKPGIWMERFKEFLAFPMYLTAAWLLWVLVQQSGANALFVAMASMVGIGFAVWLGKTGVKKIAIILYISIIGLSAYLLTRNVEYVVPIDYSKAALQQALEKDTPVFVNMTAAWCITCKVNEQTSITARSVQQSMRDNSITYIYGDWTKYDENITEYLESFQRNGVPLYVIYPPKNANGTRPEPRVLPQILTPNILKNAFSDQD